MSALSWVRFARRVPALVRQRELPNLEALLDAEAERQPNSNYFVLSCAIPAGIAVFGGGSVFVAWLNGNTGLPLWMGSIFTVALAAGAWYMFFRLYKSVPESKRNLRKLIMKFLPRYSSLGNIFGGEHVLSEEFASVVDEVARHYLKHCSDTASQQGDAPAKAARAIEAAMARIMEAANFTDRSSQERAMVWAQPMLDELRSLDLELDQFAILSQSEDRDDPLAGLRNARSELQSITAASQEMADHVAI